MQGDCWICMELMAISLDKLYKFVHGPASDDDQLPEHILGRIASAVCTTMLAKLLMKMGSNSKRYCLHVYVVVFLDYQSLELLKREVKNNAQR